MQIGKRMKKIVALAAGAALMAALAACGASETASEPQQPQQPAQAAPAQAAAAPAQGQMVAPEQPAAPAAAEPAPTAVLPPAVPAFAQPTPMVFSAVPTPETTGMARMGGTLKIVPQGSLKSVDPQWTTLIVTAHVARHTMEGLFHVDESFAPAPMMVDDWDVSDDGLTWNFNLRDGLRYHDGRAVTAADVVGSFDRVKEKAGMYKRLMGEFGAEMTADGDSSITITLTEPTALVLDSIHTNQSFAPYVLPEEIHTLPQTESAQDVIGTGPFKFVRWAPGDRWTAERWVDYAKRDEPNSALAGGHTVYLDAIEWIEVPDMASRIAALSVGQVHALDEFKADFVPQIKADPNLNLFINKPGNGTSVWVNHLKPPFNDKRVRRALQLAYPMERALTAAVGDPEFWSLCTNHQACFTRWDTDSGSEGKYNVQDIEAAKALIAEAGVEGASVRVMQPLDMPVLPDLAAVTAEVLTELGFDVDLQPMDWATLGTRRADPELWEAFHTWSGTGRVLGPLTNTSLQKDGWFNRYQDESGRMTELMNGFARAKSAEEQFEIWEEINTFAFEDMPVIRIGDFYPPLASRKEVKGWNPIPFPVLWDTWLDES